MRIEQMEEVFDFYTYSRLFANIQYPAEGSELVSCMEKDELESFFEYFSFQDYDELSFEEFHYWFHIFTVVQRQHH